MLVQMMVNELDDCLEELVEEKMGMTKRNESSTERTPVEHKYTSPTQKHKALIAKFGAISDYDAREIIPRFSASYNNAANRIVNSSLDDKAKYEALYSLSTMRADMGIDKRLREINKGPIPWVENF